MRCVGSRTLFLVLPLMLTSVACGPSQEQLDAELARVRELRAELEAAQAQRQDLEARLGQLQGVNQDLGDRLRALGP